MPPKNKSNIRYEPYDSSRSASSSPVRSNSPTKRSSSVQRSGTRASSSLRVQALTRQSRLNEQPLASPTTTTRGSGRGTRGTRGTRGRGSNSQTYSPVDNVIATGPIVETVPSLSVLIRFKLKNFNNN